jgi:uncharacterized SAM-binding protein YcdF (DUF218 family)
MFLFSKLFGILLNPLLWILCAMAWAVASKKAAVKRRALWAALLMTVFFSNGWVVKNLIAAYSMKPMPIGKGETYEAGILLAGISSYDRKADWAYFAQDADRFIQTLWLYRQGHIRRIVVSGGHGDPFSEKKFIEADYLAQKFMEMGVPKEDILIDGESRNTIENASETARMMDSAGIKQTPVLITSAYHMPRSMWLFRSRGVQVRPYPSNFLTKPSGESLSLRSLLPSTNSFELWRVLLHETVGFAYARITAR